MAIDVHPSTRGRIGRWALLAVALPWAITVGWPWVLLMCALRLADGMRWEPLGVLTAQWRPWTSARWRWSTTVGRGIVYQPSHRLAPKGQAYGRVQHHEHVHIRQVEDAMTVALIIGASVGLALGSWIAWLAIWWSGGAWQAVSMGTAWLRGGDAYRDAEHERSAYAQADGGKQ